MRQVPLVLCLLATVGAVPALAQQVMLTSEGGDAWTFHKRIEGTVTGGTCDEIAVSGPAGSVMATQTGAQFIAILPLRKGVNPVRASCWRDGVAVTASMPQRWTVRLADQPKAVPRIAPTERGLTFDAGASEMAPGEPAPIVAWRWTARPRSEDVANREAPAVAFASGRRVEIELPPRGDYDVELSIADAAGRSDTGFARLRVQDGKAAAIDPRDDRPHWLDNAVVYGAVPFLFGPSGLPDVTARLGAIRALGATAIWLSPIMESPGEDFGYAVVDPFAVRGSLGGEAALRHLVHAAHALGLRVLLDLVPNHLSEHHPYHADAARRGAASAYAGFFDRDSAGAATSYFDWSHLKNLNFDNAEVQRYVIEASLRWVRDFGIDGFRVDASWGVRQRAPEFWPRWRAELKRIKPDLLLLSESSARDPYYLSQGFDATYDWTDKLGEWTWQSAFDGPNAADALRHALAVAVAGRGGQDRVLRFLENNDTGARFVTRHGGGMTRAAAAMLLTLPGVPLIYAGQEIGAAYEPYGPRKAIDWRNDPEGLRAFYTRLIALRARTPALRGAELRLLETDARAVLAYIRPGATRDDDLIVALNFSGAAVRARFTAPEIAAFVRAGDVLDLVTGDAGAELGADASLELPPFGAVLLRQNVRSG